MPEPLPPSEDLSISDGFDKVKEELAKDAPPAPDNPPDGSSTGAGDAAPKPGEDAPGGTPPPKPDAKPGEPPPTDPIIDPKTGVYKGEYTPERFNGLMSAWQADHLELIKLRGKGDGQPTPDKPAQPPAQNDEDIELPPELKDADESTKDGYRVMMKGVQRHFAKMQQDILGKVLDAVNQPAREEAETTSRVLGEIKTLEVKGGKLFTENKKEILQFAADNDFPLGQLDLAFKMWSKQQELSGRLAELTKGKKVVDEIQNDEKKNGALPTHSAPAGAKNLVFDEARDGEKSSEEVWAEVAAAL